MREISKLKQMNACPQALTYLKRQGSYQKAWKRCDRGDWMLWLLGKVLDEENKTEFRKLTLAKARCAKLVADLTNNKYSKKAIEVAEDFGLGEATREELDSAAAKAFVYATTDATFTSTSSFADFASLASASTSSLLFASAFVSASASAASAAAATAAAVCSASSVYLSPQASAYLSADAVASAIAYYEASMDASNTQTIDASHTLKSAYAARLKVLSNCARIVREVYPKPPNLIKEKRYERNI
jgi:hypothetical protein